MASRNQELIDKAFSALGANPSLDQIKDVSDVVKTLNEAVQVEEKLQNAASERKSDIYKSVATLLVPIISIITVLVSLLTQREQSILSRQQDEDKQWREFLATLRTGYNPTTGTLVFDPTLPAQIKSFLHSSTYKDQAIDLAKRLAGHLANQASFDELMSVAFPSDQDASISDLIDLNKAVTRSEGSIGSSCAITSAEYNLPPTGWPKICDFQAIPDTEVQKYIPTAQLNNVMQLRSQYSASVQELYIVSDKVAKWIRKNNYDGSSSLNSNINILNGVFLFSSTIAGATIVNADLSNTTFDTMDFSNATISSTSGRIGGVGSTNWWDAAKIDPVTLNFLIENFYPGYTREYIAFPGFIRGNAKAGPVINIDEYKQKIFVLCHVSGHDCYDKIISFKPENILGLAR